MKKTASQGLQSQSSLVLSPLMTHSSTMRRATAANGEQASTDARQDDADRSPSQSPVGNQMHVYFASGTEASAETSAQVSTRGEREETEPKSPAVARLIPGTARSLTQEDATPLALDSVTQSPPVNDSITPGDDATSSDDGSPPSGVIITPPLPATETGPDDPLIAYYNGDPTAVDEDDETEAISVKPGTIKTLASLYPSESTIQAGSEDGEYELVDEDLDLQGRETIAWHPRLINIEGTQETMTPFDSKDINELAGLKVDKPSLPTDEATAALSAVQQAREDAANAISEGSPPELAPSSPYPYHSSPTPAPRTPTKRRRNKRLQNSMRSMLDDDHELESFPHAAREVQPGSTASVVEGHEDRASLSRTPAEQAHEGSNLDLLSAVAKRERYQKCIDSAHTPQSLPLPDFSHNAEEKKRLSGGKESWRPSQVELNKPDIKVTESKLEVYVEEWSKDDKRGILADPDKLYVTFFAFLTRH